ncbi:DUF1240 domain-containing protein [Xenorhabdus bovienii]|uniref:DUF1240 domain-containing protein n=1 Tax=Xenorhabdus bovienii TaxID=40576 RepID=UPI00237CB332|nr:DUF1240 domain-containing protein [Xenorhabdus bovienii]MDE1484220.1 DUF1240 domain-containing protein [Xenorhabdus bovienii]MDE9430423.1 DUF1240 domain-containing protein [Xenorhabdus bovienii]MDE9436931.1 DUF1240 domain-containing protein [Xenorhabdus bovienii]MDE9443416.1 DUF1240 domain-containing protein [Xenorhabdus bovienii]MDE9470862.1 DUF1240 domain-containing protein [Xenorhabdus bovienii]
MNSKYFKVLGAIILLLLVIFMIGFIIDDAVSLILMKDEITFSATVVMVVMSSPLLFYAFSGFVFFFIFDRLPKFNKIIVNYLVRLAILSFIISFPVSFYVNYKLKSDGYLTCDKISWMSPTTYVKDIKLCK